jgi:hypothetical protein
MKRWFLPRGSRNTLQEVVATLDELDARVARDPETARAYPTISRQVRIWVQDDPESILRLLQEDQHSPAYVCFAAVFALLERGLISGDNHFSRGVLDSYGRSLWATHKIVTSERERLGLADADTLQAETAQLDMLISKAYPNAKQIWRHTGQPRRSEYQ